MGRPTKLTTEVQSKIVKAMRAGNYFSVACQYAGISEGTGYRWMRWGHPEYDAERDPDTKNPAPRSLTPYRKFRQAVVEASSTAEVEAVAQLRSAGAKDWRAAEAFLKRRASERWNVEHSHVRHEGEVALGGPVVQALTEYADVLAAMAGGECTCLPGMAADEFQPGCPEHDPEAMA